jgi:hypothetical protein
LSCDLVLKHGRTLRFGSGSSWEDKEKIMAGKVIRVIPLNAYDFTQVSTTGQTITIVRGIDVSNYKSGDLIVRSHSGGVAPPSSQADVTVIQDGNTSEDPSSVFNGATVATKSMATADITGGPKVWVVALSAAMGSMLAVTLFAKPGTQGQTLTVKISADIVLRDA